MTNDVDRIQQAVSTAMSDLIEESFILVGAPRRDVRQRLAAGPDVVCRHCRWPSSPWPPSAGKLKKRGRQSQAKMAEIYNLIHETITGNKIVKAFTMERFELRKFLNASGAISGSISGWPGFRRSPRRSWSLSAAPSARLSCPSGPKRIASNQISPGDFGSFAMAIFMMFTPIKRLSRANNVVQQATACYDRIQEVLCAVPQIQDRPNAYPLPPVRARSGSRKSAFLMTNSAPCCSTSISRSRPPTNGGPRRIERSRENDHHQSSRPLL